MLQFLVRRPIAVILSFIAASAIGLLLFFYTPISLLPNIPIPEITVHLTYPGTSAKDMERIVVKQMRQSLLQVNHLKDIESHAQFGGAYIDMRFEFGTDINLASIEVNEKIDQIFSRLPKDMERPIVSKANAGDIPVFYLNIAKKSANSDQGLQVSEWVQNILIRRMEQLPEIAFVDVSGYSQPQIFIVPDETALRRYNLQAKDIESALVEQNIKPKQFAFKDGQYQYQVEMRSNLKNIDDIKGIYLNVGNQLLTIKDVAKVRLAPQERFGKHLYNGESAIILSIHKKSKARIFSLASSVQDLLIQLRKEEPTLFFELSNDQSQLLRISIDNLKVSLFFGTFCAMSVMFFFYRRWELALLIIITVPIALCLVLIGFHICGIGINILSLAGLILGVGLMFDNAIIVIDNIRQNTAPNTQQEAAIVYGANEVIRPLISSALTTCSVFIPLIYVSGITGALFYDQAFSIAIALFCSLLVSYLLLPTLYKLAIVDRSRLEYNNIYAFLQRSINILLKHPINSALLIFALFLITFIPLSKLPVSAFPEIKKRSLELRMDWNEPLQVSEQENRIKKLLQALQPDLKTSNTFIAKQQFRLNLRTLDQNQAIIRLFFDDPNHGDIIIGRIQNFLEQYPYVSYSFHATENIFDRLFQPDRPDLVAQISINQLGEGLNISDVLTVKKQLEEAQIVANFPVLSEDITITILHDLALLYNLDTEQIIYQLKTIFNENKISQLYASSTVIPIRLKTNGQLFFKQLETALIKNRDGEWLNLINFIKVGRTQQLKEVTSKKSGEILPLSFERYSSKVVNGLRNFINKHKRYSLSFTGQYFENKVLIEEFKKIGLLSLLFLYLILAAQFESLLQPLIVLISIPIGIAGALFSLWLFQQSLNLMAIIGIIVMVGIDVNDSILKVDMINRKYKESGQLKWAIHEGGRRRVKPILMTSLTTILAMVPILLSQGLGAELQMPLAIALIGGLTIGTLSSIYVIPLAYTFFHTLRNPFGSTKNIN